jgi:hypothetical protein
MDGIQNIKGILKSSMVAHYPCILEAIGRRGSILRQNDARRPWAVERSAELQLNEGSVEGDFGGTRGVPRTGKEKQGF